MAQLVIPTTVDTLSTDGNCLYPAAALGGQPIVSPNIKIDGQLVEFYTASTVPATVDGQKINPFLPVACQPGVRVIQATVNLSLIHI